jgi:hypothetical protein
VETLSRVFKSAKGLEKKKLFTALASEMHTDDRLLWVNSVIRQSDFEGKNSHLDTLLNSVTSEEKSFLMQKILNMDANSNDAAVKRDRAQMIAGLVDQDDVLAELKMLHPSIFTSEGKNEAIGDTTERDNFFDASDMVDLEIVQGGNADASSPHDHDLDLVNTASNEAGTTNGVQSESRGECWNQSEEGNSESMRECWINAKAGTERRLNLGLAQNQAKAGTEAMEDNQVQNQTDGLTRLLSAKKVGANMRMVHGRTNKTGKIAAGEQEISLALTDEDAANPNNASAGKEHRGTQTDNTMGRQEGAGGGVGDGGNSSEHDNSSEHHMGENGGNHGGRDHDDGDHGHAGNHQKHRKSIRHKKKSGSIDDTYSIPCPFSRFFVITPSRRPKMALHKTTYKTILKLYHERSLVLYTEHTSDEHEHFNFFCYEHFLMLYGLKKCAEQHLLAFLESLQRWKSSCPFVNVCCRLLQLHDPLEESYLKVYLSAMDCVAKCTTGNSLPCLDEYIPMLSLERAKACVKQLVGSKLSLGSERFGLLMSQITFRSKEYPKITQPGKRALRLDMFLGLMLSFAEAQQEHAQVLLNALFTAADINHDGKLSFSEFGMLLELAKIDINLDDKLATMYRESHAEDDTDRLTKELFVGNKLLQLPHPLQPLALPLSRVRFIFLCCVL